MGKYDALGSYLRRRKQPVIELSFVDIERIICALLPNCAADASWWANERRNERGFVQCRSWLDAGFQAEAVPRVDKVVFQKVDLRQDRFSGSLEPEHGSGSAAGRHRVQKRES
jgi:hypothetical protein